MEVAGVWCYIFINLIATPPNRNGMHSFVDLIPRCTYCGVRLSKYTRTVDHVVPLSAGGEDIASNKVWSCRNCNQSKGAKTLREWEQFLTEKLKQRKSLSGPAMKRMESILNSIRRSKQDAH